jgi:hypothetical protein
MMLEKFAFIVKAPGYSAEKHSTELSSDQFSTRIVGVAHLDEAIMMARKLIDEGVQLIELCGGFSQSDRAALLDQTNHKIPVGVVMYTPDQEAELLKLFG